MGQWASNLRGTSTGCGCYYSKCSGMLRACLTFCFSLILDTYQRPGLCPESRAMCFTGQSGLSQWDKCLWRVAQGQHPIRSYLAHINQGTRVMKVSFVLTFLYSCKSWCVCAHEKYMSLKSCSYLFLSLCCSENWEFMTSCLNKLIEYLCLSMNWILIYCLNKVVAGSLSLLSTFK